MLTLPNVPTDHALSRVTVLVIDPEPLYRWFVTEALAGCAVDVMTSASIEDAVPYLDSVNLEGLASKITCPLQIVHGGRDPITPTENATRLQAEAKGPTELLFWEDSLHCAHDRAHICRPAMADFMRLHL